MKLGIEKNGMRYHEAAKMEGEVGGQAKRGLDRQRRAAKSEVLFLLPLPSFCHSSSSNCFFFCYLLTGNKKDRRSAMKG